MYLERKNRISLYLIVVTNHSGLVALILASLIFNSIKGCIREAVSAFIDTITQETLNVKLHLK
jgi:hypothetical protein